MIIDVVEVVANVVGAFVFVVGMMIVIKLIIRRIGSIFVTVVVVRKEWL